MPESDTGHGPLNFFRSFGVFGMQRRANMSRVVSSQVAFWVLDHTPLVAGITILALAPRGPAWTAAGWCAIGLALLRWLAEASGYHLPRPGRTRVIAYGCWEQPMAFAVRRPSRTLIFYRPFEASGDLPDAYQVFALSPMDEREIRSSWSQQSPPEGHLLGQVPLSTLRFEHGSGCWVRTASIVAIEAGLRTR